MAAAVCSAFAWAEDPYVESTGVGGIDTHYKVKSSTRIAVDFALTTVAQESGGRLFGADSSTSNLKTVLGFYIGGNPGCWVFGFGTAEEGWKGVWPKNASGEYLYLDTARHTVEYDFPRQRHTYYTGGKAVAWATDTLAYTQEATASLFLFSTDGGQRPVKARIYGAKIYEMVGEAYRLVHDFVPFCGDGVPGFLCRETGRVIGASQPSAFSVGGEGVIERESPFVATPERNYDGATDQTKSYLDTHYKATQETRAEIDFAFRTAPVSGKASWLFCGHGSSVFGVCSKNSGFMMSNGAGWPSIASGAATETDVRRTAILDNVSDTFYLVTAGVTNLTKAAGTSTGNYDADTIKIGTYYNAAQEFGALKVYAFRIYEAGRLVRNFQPVWRDGVAGMEDALTGMFICCPDATRAGLELAESIPAACQAYVQTEQAAKQYLDTGYTPQKKTRCEVDYALMANPSGTTSYIFCGRNANVWGAYVNGSGFGWYAGSWKSGTASFAVSREFGVRRTAVVDNVANAGLLVTGSATNGVTTIAANNTGSNAADLSIKIAAKHDANGEYGSLRIFGCRIYEDGVLKHRYLPAVKDDGTVGLQDELTASFLPVLSKGTENPQVYGGAFVPSVTPRVARLGFGKTVTATAKAPGASSYEWRRNGQVMAGETGASLTVDWRKGCETDVYEVRSLVTMDGRTVRSGWSQAVSVEHLLAGFSLIVQ
jgi:hypothetical protein